MDQIACSQNAFLGSVEVERNDGRFQVVRFNIPGYRIGMGADVTAATRVAIVVRSIDDTVSMDDDPQMTLVTPPTAMLDPLPIIHPASGYCADVCSKVSGVASGRPVMAEDDFPDRP